MVGRHTTLRRIVAERTAWHFALIEIAGDNPTVDGAAVSALLPPTARRFEEILGNGPGALEKHCRRAHPNHAGFILANYDDAAKLFDPMPLATASFRKVLVTLVADCIVARCFLERSKQRKIALRARFRAFAVSLRSRLLAGSRRPAPWRREFKALGKAMRPSLAEHLQAVARRKADRLGPWHDICSASAELYVGALRLRPAAKLGLFERSSAMHARVAGFAAAQDPASTPKARSQHPRKAAGVPRRPGIAATLEKRLWNGFSGAALADLRRLQQDRSAPATEQSSAAWHLAKWHALQGDVPSALGALDAARRADPSRPVRPAEACLEADWLLRQGRIEAARSVLDREIAKSGEGPDLCLSYANSFCYEGGRQADEMRLAWINRLFAGSGFAPMEPANAALPLSIDNLAARAERPCSLASAPKVTVIVPAFNAEQTVATALRSILVQTWSNLEVIVVDDASTDGTFDIVRALAAEDCRIVPIRHERNQGNYVARNTALARAGGDFITVHDADDWSHPQKLEAEVRHLLLYPHIHAVYLKWARVRKNMLVTGSWRPGGGLLQNNDSSLMFRRSVHEALGYWDRVRVAGDLEFLWRIGLAFGLNAVVGLHPSVPLSFALHHDASLTQHGPTHVRTAGYGVRREYLEGADWWHAQAAGRSEALRMERHPEARRFPVPRRIRPDPSPLPAFDFLFVMDFSLKGGTFLSVFNTILACIRWGKTAAVFHWPRYDGDPGKPLDDRIRQLAADGTIEIAIADDAVEADTVIVGCPAILATMIDRPPKVRCNRVLLLANRAADLVPDGSESPCDPAAVRETAVAAFGREPRWIPASDAVRRALQMYASRLTSHLDPWTPLVDLEQLCLAPLRWRGGTGSRPLLGRHCRDDWTKWPSSAAAIKLAYCVDRPCEVQFLGGAAHATDLLSATPANWTVFGFDALDVGGFLRGIDFFVHHPHEDRVEEWGCAVVEALAAGIPAILPPSLRKTFGPAALYADPHEVWPIIASLWTDQTAYLAQARAARDHAIAHAGFDQMIVRAARLRKAAHKLKPAQNTLLNPPVEVVQSSNVQNNG